jgi:hypothetical protein
MLLGKVHKWLRMVNSDRRAEILWLETMVAIIDASKIYIYKYIYMYILYLTTND